MSELEEFAEEAEYSDGPAITLGDLRDGESVILAFQAMPETFESEYGEAVRADATFLESEDYTWTPDDHGTVENGDDVTLVTWSKRLVRGLLDADDKHGLVGNGFEITKRGSGYETEWSVELVDESD